jgi:V8-like Glu-specific endopeptidase
LGRAVLSRRHANFGGTYGLKRRFARQTAPRHSHRSNVSPDYWPNDREKGRDMGRNRTVRNSIGGLVALICFLVTGNPALSETMTPLRGDDRLLWLAVGHLSGPGFRLRRGCTGTLIAPDLVVTAAHCLTGALGNDKLQMFRAGWHVDRATAERRYVDVHIHPAYARHRGPDRLAYDVAVVRLKEPIPKALIPQLRLAPSRDAKPGRVLLLGYRHDRPNVLHGASDCPALPEPRRGIVHYGCEVVAGTSGGPVIAKTEAGPVMVAVIVARHEPDGHAIAVPVNTWLREKLLQSGASTLP